MRADRHERKRKNFIVIAELVIVMLVLMKTLLFYIFTDAERMFWLVLLITVFITWLWMSLIREKVPAVALVIYGLITTLMFVDVVFYGYFGRLITVGMSGNAEVLGDIGECIKQALKPQFFVMFIDFFAILAFEIYLKRTGLAFDRLIILPFGRIYITIGKIVIGLLLILSLIFNPLGLSFVQTISHEEFYSFHIKDFAGIDAGLDFKGEYVEGEGYAPDYTDPIFGLGEGKNLIVIQMESFMNFAIGKSCQGKEITPNINKLLMNQDTVYFDNYYQQVGAGNTSDAEFATNNSFIGSSYSYTYALYYENYFKGLPYLLKEKGYNTSVFHAYDSKFWNRDTAYPSLGFDRFYSKKDFDKGDKIGWGLCDVDFFQQTAAMLSEIRKPFYAMTITLSGHYPYNMGADNKTFKADKQINANFAKYLDAVHYTDEAVGAFIEALKDEGIYDSCIIAMYGDHQGFAIENDDYRDSFENFLRREPRMDDQMNVPLIIHMPGATAKLRQESGNNSDLFKRTISAAGGQTDFMPTICYLMGFDSLDTFYMGSNLFKETEGFVSEKYYAPTGTFIKGNLVFRMSDDYVFENSRAWDRVTREEISIYGLYDDVQKAYGIIAKANDILVNDELRFTIGGQNQDDYVIPERVTLNMDGTVYVPGQENNTEMDENMAPVENATGILGEDTTIKEGVTLTQEDIAGWEQSIEESGRITFTNPDTGQRVYIDQETGNVISITPIPPEPVEENIPADTAPDEQSSGPAIEEQETPTTENQTPDAPVWLGSE